MIKTKNKFRIIVTLNKSTQEFKLTKKSKAHTVKYLNLTKLRGRK